MHEKALSIPEIALIAGTRVALGAGLGLVLSGKMNRKVRKGAGWALLAVGLLSTVPLACEVAGRDFIGSADGASDDA